jgi:hypothetical protein
MGRSRASTALRGDAASSCPTSEAGGDPVAEGAMGGAAGTRQGNLRTTNHEVPPPVLIA